MRHVDDLQENIRRDTEEVITRLNSDRNELDQLHKPLRQQTVRATDMEVIRQQQELMTAAAAGMRKITVGFSPYDRLVTARGWFSLPVQLCLV